MAGSLARPGTVLEERPAGSRSNNFDAIRLVAALTVVIGHAWPLTGRAEPPSIAGVPVYDFAVFVFFALSGYLISSSWTRTPSPRVFLVNRTLRIFPALTVVVVVTTLVIGPVVTDLGTRAYFAASGTWAYLANVTLVASYDLPGVFTGNPLTAVNGVLWSLGPEFVCYLAVLALGVTLRNRRMLGYIVTAAALALLALTSGEPLRTIATAMVFFGVSAIIGTAAAGRRLPLWPTVALVPLWLVASAVVPATAIPLAWLAVPYTVIAIGAASTPVVRRLGRFGDFSYGLYLWGFVVQQVIVSAWPDLSILLNLAIVVPLTALLAIASWHLIEKRALRLKPRSSPAAQPLHSPQR